MKTIFIYDNLDDYSYLKNLFYKANRDFLKYDLDIIKNNSKETSLCAALKTRFDRYLLSDNINDYFIDIEYNRNKDGTIKTIINDKLEIVKMQCDFILHSRGHITEQDNLLALEMKKSYRSQEEKDSDRNRLIALTKSTYNNDIWSFDGKTLPEHVCRYIIGIYYEIDLKHNRILLEFYRQGKIMETKIIRLPLYLSKRLISNN